MTPDDDAKYFCLIVLAVLLLTVALACGVFTIGEWWSERKKKP